MAITINGDSSTPQPQALNEYFDDAYTDQDALDDSRTRLYANSAGKKVAELSWDWLPPSLYQTIVAYFRSRGTAITYANPNSAMPGGACNFTGIATVKEQPYRRGGSLRKGLTVTIREA